MNRINAERHQELYKTADISTICEMINQLFLSSDHEAIIEFMEDVITFDLDEISLQSLINIVEKNYIIGSNVELREYLAILYYKLDDKYMSLYYMSLLPNDFYLRSSRLADLKKKCKLLDVFIENSPHIVPYEFKREYLYGGESKEYSVHSFSREIGKNMTLLKTPYGVVIFDCGAKTGINKTDIITEIELLETFKELDISLDDIISIIISHAHLDHYGSLISLMNLGIDLSKIYINEITKNLIQQASINMPSLRDILSINSFFVPYDRVKINSFKNGHILGSEGYVVSFDNVNVIYTGDFCLHDQIAVPGLNPNNILNMKCIMNNGVDCLITETTYGQRNNTIPYKRMTAIFKHFVDSLIECDYKVFIPSFAIGRSQEVALLLNDNHKVLIDGLAIWLSQVYEELSGIKIFNENTRFSTEEEYKEHNFDCNNVIIASSGMLAINSTSYKYVMSLLNSNENIAIIKTGYISSESYGNLLLDQWKGQDNRLFDISLSSHADRNEIFELINMLDPKNIVTIHGKGFDHSTDNLETAYENQEIISVIKAEVAYEEVHVESDENDSSYVENKDISNKSNEERFVINKNDNEESEYDNNNEAPKTIEKKVFRPLINWHEGDNEMICIEDIELQRLIKRMIDEFNEVQISKAGSPNYESNKDFMTVFYEFFKYLRLYPANKQIYNFVRSFGKDFAAIDKALNIIVQNNFVLQPKAVYSNLTETK